VRWRHLGLRTAWLSETAARIIVESAKRAHPHETGGVLVGVLVHGVPWITSVIEVPPGSPRASTYQLPSDARPCAVAQERIKEPRVGYLGDWHSHPADVGASPTDAAALMSLARNRDAHSPHPLLIVARRRGDGYELEAQRVEDDRLAATRLIAAGPLPSERR
jgi:proteasome lid subunit RPN8/RPN11